MAAGVIDKERAPGGGGGIDNPPRPVDFDDSENDPRSYQSRVERAVFSSDQIRRYGRLQPQYTGVLPPELARVAERRTDTIPLAGEIAILGYNQFGYEESLN